MGEEGNFALRDWDPVEILKDSKGVMWSREQVWMSRPATEFIEDFGRCTTKNAITTVNSRCDEGIDQGLSSRYSRMMDVDGLCFFGGKSQFWFKDKHGDRK